MNIKKIAPLLFITLSISFSLNAKDPPELTWETMERLNYVTGKMPENLKKHQNKTVKVTGFIVPLELDEYINTVKEFILVPDPMSCIHVPPPPPNQMIYIKMKHAIPLDMDYRGVEIHGILNIPKPKNETDYISFELIGEHAKEANLEFDDPLFDLLDPH